MIFLSNSIYPTAVAVDKYHHMKSDRALKDLVQKKYASIAGQATELNAASCCGATAASGEVYNIMTDDYSSVKGHVEEADLGLGCGLPTAYAQISPGDTVIDLGSGAGNDCFVARHETGEKGKVIGIDFTPEMIAKARENAEKLGYNNVEFRQGDIEFMPVNDDVADVVVSNCVLNLVPNKSAVFEEMFRVTKPGGHFSVSDITLVGDLPEALKHDAEMYAGCVAGAIQKDNYLKIIEQAGFKNITLQKEKPITIPNDILKKFLNQKELEDFNRGGIGIYSITVYAEKPGPTGSKKRKTSRELNPAGCAPGSGCC